MNRLVNASPDQPLLLPVDSREWFPVDDLVHFVREAGAVPKHRLKPRNLRPLCSGDNDV